MVSSRVLLVCCTVVSLAAACSSTEDSDTRQPTETTGDAPYRTDELRPDLRGLVDPSDDIDQLMLGVFEGQLLSVEASVDRFVDRVEALEPAVTACLENTTSLRGDTAQRFARGLLSETFGIEGPDGSIVVAFPDVVWQDIGPANADAEFAADASGCIDEVQEKNGSVFVGPVGQTYVDLLRTDDWRTPDGFDDLFTQAIVDHCGPDPFEQCDDEASVVIQMLPVYRETIQLNLDELD